MTNVSKVYFGLSRAWAGRGSPGGGRPGRLGGRCGRPECSPPCRVSWCSGKPPIGSSWPRASRPVTAGPPPRGESYSRSGAAGPAAPAGPGPARDPGAASGPPAGPRSCPAPGGGGAPRPGGGLGRGGDGAAGGRGVDGHRELDVAAELAGERVGDQGPEPGFELFLDELVGGGDEGGVLDQAEGPGQPQPGALMRLDLEIGEFLKGSRPYLRQVRLAHWVFTLRPHMRIN